MRALLIISVIFLGFAIISLAGFAISLIVGAVTNSPKAKKIGIIGTSISGGVFLISLIGTVTGASSVGYNEISSRVERSLNERSNRHRDYDDRDYDDYDNYDDDGDSDSHRDGDHDIDDFDFYRTGRKVRFDTGEMIQVDSIKEKSEKLPGQKDGETAVVAEATITAPSNRSMDLEATKFEILDNNDHVGYLNSKTHDQSNFPTKLDAGKSAKVKLYFTVTNKGRYALTYGEAAWEQ
ncbi:DUF4352 domain-containing protein [Lactobacillus sp. YT155]|uniref:DUF4352 domain-containing protein n=1 Tax=Lactobacillus sp. YT155 TaxID=3060955 RepID=UPI00265E9517|nr:DUF4352 domain-containing protein [Lactobacillus sp. YT155]MDO1605652.1 DUF4352 domain-containing protein [Lactobacillus sp. YT155]